MPTREPNTNAADTWWTIDTASQMIERPKRTLYHWIREQRLESQRDPRDNHSYLVRAEDVVRLDRTTAKKGYVSKTVTLTRRDGTKIVLQNIHRPTTRSRTRKVSEVEIGDTQTG